MHYKVAQYNLNGYKTKKYYWEILLMVKLKKKEPILFIMEIFIKVILKMDYLMAMVSILHNFHH